MALNSSKGKLMRPTLLLNPIAAAAPDCAHKSLCYDATLILHRHIGAKADSGTILTQALENAHFHKNEF